MNINKNNYEAFFLDYYEGTLTPAQERELMLFLEQHPHLRAAFESFEMVSLDEPEEEVKLEDKESLKKHAVTEANFEEMAVAFIEGTLPAELRASFNAFLEKNPPYKTSFELYSKTVLPADKITFERKASLKKKEEELPSTFSENEVLFISAVEGTLTPGSEEQLRVLLADPQEKAVFEVYRKTKLQPDTSVIFPGKEALKKKKDRQPVPFFYYLAAAASIALLAGLFFLLPKHSPEGNAQPIAKNDLVLPKEGGHGRPVLPVKDSSADKQEQNVIVHNPYKKNPVPKDRPVKISPLEEQEHQEIIVKQPVHPDKPDSLPVIVQNNKPSSYNNIVLVNNFNDSDEVPVKRNEDYFSLGQMVSYKVKNALLKNEMQDSSSYQEDKKKFTWYDAVLVLTKGIRNITGREVDVKKKYDENKELVAYEFSAGRYTYTRPVNK